MLKLTVIFCLLVAALAEKSPLLDSEWEGRIVGGSTAAVGQFPHQVSMRSAAGLHFCGGFIISDRWVGCAGKLELI
jgi:secreted trypsin-like serine protease